MLLEELVQKITVKANTKAYDTVDKKQKVLIKNNSVLASSFSKAFATLGGVFALSSITRIADEWTNIASSLSLVTKSETERLRVEKELFAISQKTRQSMTASVELYRRISISAKSMNLSEKERLQATENINKAVIIGGGTSASQQAALFQLSQGLASGQLRGQELNSVLEQTPRLAQLIAEGMGLEVGDLRKTAEAGKITASEVMRAVLSQTQTLNKEYAKIRPTISSSLTVLRNSFGAFFNEINKSGGLTEKLSESITNIAEVISSKAVMSSFKTIGKLLGIMVEHMKTLFILLIVKKMFSSTSLGVFALELARTGSLLKTIKYMMAALNFSGLVKGAALATVAFGKWALIIGLLIEGIETLQGKDTFLGDVRDKFFNSLDITVGKGLDALGESTGLWQPKGYNGASVNQTINITSNAEVSPEKIKTIIKQENDSLITNLNMKNGFSTTA